MDDEVSRLFDEAKDKTLLLRKRRNAVRKLARKSDENVLDLLFDLLRDEKLIDENLYFYIKRHRFSKFTPLTYYRRIQKDDSRHRFLFLDELRDNYSFEKPKIPTRVKAFIRSCLNDPDDKVIAMAAQVLFEIPDKLAYDQLLLLIKHKNPIVRATAVMALRECENPLALDSFLELFHDPHPDVRLCALLGVSRPPNSKNYEPLIGIIQNRNEPDKNRREAIKVLAYSTDERAIFYICEKLLDPNEDGFLRDAAMTAMGYYWINFEMRVYDALISENNPDLLYRIPDELRGITGGQKFEILEKLLLGDYDVRIQRYVLKAYEDIEHRHMYVKIDPLIKYYYKTGNVSAIRVIKKVSFTIEFG